MIINKNVQISAYIFLSFLLAGCNQTLETKSAVAGTSRYTFLEPGKTYCFMSKELNRTFEDQPKQWNTSYEIEYVEGKVTAIEDNYANIQFTTIMSAAGPVRQKFGSAWVNLGQINMIAQPGSGFCAG